MSAKDDSDSEEKRDAGELRPTVNPFVAAAMGAALLSTDPAVTFAAQSARDAIFFPQAAAPPMMILADRPAEEPALKDLLGEVNILELCLGCISVVLFGW